MQSPPRGPLLPRSPSQAHHLPEGCRGRAPAARHRRGGWAWPRDSQEWAELAGERLGGFLNYFFFFPPNFFFSPPFCFSPVLLPHAASPGAAATRLEAAGSRQVLYSPAAAASRPRSAPPRETAAGERSGTRARVGGARGGGGGPRGRPRPPAAPLQRPPSARRQPRRSPPQLPETRVGRPVPRGSVGMGTVRGEFPRGEAAGAA